MSTKPSFLLTLICSNGHTTALKTEEASRDTIDHESYGSSYQLSERTVVEWECMHEGCAGLPYNDRWNRITL